MGMMAFSRKNNPTTVHGLNHPGAPAHNPSPNTRNRIANNHVIHVIESISLAILFSSPRITVSGEYEDGQLSPEYKQSYGDFGN